MNIEYLARAAWGTRTDIPRLGHPVDPALRTEVHTHHSAAIDGDDSTPNRWDRDEAIAYQRRLQTVRPDLGLDVPYTDVLYCLEDLSVLILEGRGLYRTGAHTKGHNTAGFGFCLAGNFHTHDDPEAITVLLAAVENRIAWLRKTKFPNLGSHRSPRGWWTFGHRDTGSTSCPGDFVYPKLAFVDPIGFHYRRAAARLLDPGAAPPTSPEPDPTPVGTPILGPAEATVDQALAFVRLVTDRRGGSPYSDSTLWEIVDTYARLGPVEGVRWDGALSQAIKETGAFTFGGDVSPKQWNFAGIGATGGIPGESFDSIEAGVRAHLRRLRLYADPDAPLTLHDLRILGRALPERIWGSAPTFEELGGEDPPDTTPDWAPSPDYGISIVRDYLTPMLATTPEDVPPLTDAEILAVRRHLAEANR